MKLIPASSARSRIAWAVGSSDETPCMNDFSSASPKVIVPRHRVETSRPLRPSLRYSMTVTSLSDLGGQRFVPASPHSPGVRLELDAELVAGQDLAALGILGERAPPGVGDRHG